MRTPRIQQIEDYVFENRSVTLDELCNNFNISMSTLRRDLSVLEEKGSIKKVYGGVYSNSREQLIPFHMRSSVNTAAKRAICELAAQFVEDNDIIFIDTGSTTCYMVDYLSELKSVTIVTNNLDVIIRAIPYTNIQVLVLPGILNRENNSFSSTNTENVFHNYNIKKAFLAASGISPDGNVSHNDPWEGALKKYAVKKAEQCYLLTDNSKFGVSSLFNFFYLANFNKIFTDKKPPESFLEKYATEADIFVYPHK